jgi:hypothetical protein
LIAFQDEILGLDSLHQAINYYQLAIVQARVEIQNRLRLELGKVYLELMYYTDERKNAQLAIDCFESVLQKSKEEEEMREACNGKSQGWFWVLSTEEEPKFYDKNEEFPFRTWAKSVASTYQNDSTAVSYYALSNWWLRRVSREDVAWFTLAWSLLQAKHQPAPPTFHYRYISTIRFLAMNEKEKRGRFMELPSLLSSLEHLALFAKTVNLKELYVIQRCVEFIFIQTSLNY